MNLNVEILYKKYYVERELYVLKINGKNTMVYKSSGLAGHNSRGKILPFYWLNEERVRRISAKPLGYLFKEYKFNNELKSIYSKDYDSFPGNMPYVLRYLENMLSKVHLEPDMVSRDKIEDDEFQNIVKDINKDLSIFFEKKEDILDWYNI